MAEETPESSDDFDFTPTPNTTLRVSNLHLTEDKVQRIFLDHAFKFKLGDVYDIRDARQAEIKNKGEILPEELEQYKDELEIINLIINYERKDFMSRCYMNHLELLRKIAKELIRLNLPITAGINPELEVYWNDNGHKLLEPIGLRLAKIKKKIFQDLVDAGILTDDSQQDTTTTTSNETPPALTKDESDIVMDGSSETTGEKKSTLNFN
ncbi:hypothetical protein ACNE9Y_31510 [Pseudomonas sp. NY11226]|uniref:hypothetical protein n=1 Tax=Pseudomonas sp. NY11226 TaxID=3400362 RepID=UPI003A8A6BE4